MLLFTALGIYSVHPYEGDRMELRARSRADAMRLYDKASELFAGRMEFAPEKVKACTVEGYQCWRFYITKGGAARLIAELVQGVDYMSYAELVQGIESHRDKAPFVRRIFTALLEWRDARRCPVREKKPQTEPELFPCEAPTA